MSNRVALYTNESHYSRFEDDIAPRPGWYVAAVTENEPGYQVYSHGFQTLADAQALADEVNEANGLTRDDVLDIVASSMRQGSVR